MNSINNKDITIFYIVGGDDEHYDNLLKNIESINLIYPNNKFKFEIYEIGNKLESKPNFEVRHISNNELKNKSKIGYIFWKNKYYAAYNIKTKYGIYLDTDTVLVNDTFERLFNQLNGKIGAAKHFWVPTFKEYKNKALTDNNSFYEFYKLQLELGIDDDYSFYAGGCFLFENNDINNKIFKKIYDIYNFYYQNKNYIKGISDEIFFSALAKENIIELNGALNHCCMGETFMPLILKEDIFYGRNQFDKEWEKVTLFHCNTARRDPTENYNDLNYKSKIKEKFRMEIK